jgi:catechol 2,3-dioxygenase-like lactoylglutathione lyase family enzyme
MPLGVAPVSWFPANREATGNGAGRQSVDFSVSGCLGQSENRVTNIPSGTELARPFVPATDLDLSKRFYMKLGFEKVLDGDVVIFRIGVSGFILTRFDEAENFMMQLMVDDLDAWWARIAALDLKNEFGVPEPRPPVMQPWGLRVAYVVDPSGVLWHVAQRRPDAPQDS